MGGTCAVTFNIRQFLRSNGEQVSRYPFDWAKTSIKQLNAVLEKDFEDYEKLEVKKFSENHPLLEKEGADEDRVEGKDREGAEGKDGKGAEEKESTEGSLILVNPYGITFAHQIIEKSAVESFSYFLREERVNAFKTIANHKNSELLFIRFETGKLKNGYVDDLKLLMQHLSQYCLQSFRFVLLLHENNKALLKDQDREDLKIMYYERYEEDWKYPNIDWPKVFGSS